MSTISMKICELIELGGAMKYANDKGDLDLKTVQHLAERAKRLCQTIKTQARATQRRNCTHANLDAGHRSIIAWSDSPRLVRFHYNCKDCGALNVRVDEPIVDPNYSVLPK